MAFVLTITLWALGKLVAANLAASRGFDLELVNALAASALIGLALYLVVTALARLRAERRAPLAPTPS
jgi:hypothetical protein